MGMSVEDLAKEIHTAQSKVPLEQAGEFTKGVCYIIARHLLANLEVSPKPQVHSLADDVQQAAERGFRS